MRYPSQPSSLFTLLASVLLCLASSSFAAGLGGDDDFLPFEQAYQVDASLEGEHASFSWRITDGYYLYHEQFELLAVNSEGSDTLALDIPAGKIKFDEVFQEERELHYHSVKVSAQVPDWPEPYQLHLTVQGCADAGLCYPPTTLYFDVREGLLLPTTEALQVNKENLSAEVPQSAPTNSAEEGGLGLTLLMVIAAFGGGLILNLMPCVFPVLSLKALSLSNSHTNPSQQRLHGWVYTLGIVVSFVAVALAILLARGAGSQLGWGFQLQEPVFVAFLCYLFFFMGMVLFGAIEIGGAWMGIGQSLTSGDGLSSSFFTGVLAAVVASPCSAPLMAPALGFAVTQDAFTALSIFIGLGLGMAFPYLLLCYSPAISRLLPAPGAWMETLKQLLAFPLFLTSAWLLLVLGAQTSSDASAWMVAGGVAVVFAFWLFKQGQGKSLGKILLGGLGLVSLVWALSLAVRIEQFSKRESAALWEAYSPERLAELRRSDTAVFVDLTADWCITCKVNEKVALHTDEVENFAKNNKIVLMQGDWTRKDERITALLSEHGRNGVPLYLMYPADEFAAPELLPQILSKSLVIEAMQRAIAD